MKNTFITLGLLATIFVGTSYASVGICDLSETDIATIEEIAVLFDTHAEDKIIKKHFKTEEYRNLARLLTEEGVSQMRTIKSDCMSESYHVEGVSMSDMEFGIQEYIYTLLKLKAFEENHNPNDVMAAQSVVMQSHLMDIVGLSGKNVLSEYRFVATINISIEENEKVTFSIATSGEGFADKFGEKNQGSFEVGIDGTVESSEVGNMSVDADMDIDLRMAGGKSFVRIQGFNLDIQSLGISDEELQEMKQFIDRIKLVEGKWIALPIDELGLDVGGLPGGLVAYLEMNFGSDIHQALSSVPVLMTYYEEGGVYYGGPNPLLCGVMMPEDIEGCLDEIEEMLTDSQGKGLITMQSLKGGYTMGISDKYTDDSYFDEEMTDFLNQSIVRWNDEKIERVAITIPEHGEAWYNNGNVHVDFVFDVPDYNWETGEIITEQGSIKADGIVGSEHVKIDINIDSPEFILELSLESFKEVIGPRTIQLPDENEVVQLESLLF